MVDLVFNNFTADKKRGAGFFKKIIQKVLDYVGSRARNVELSINLVGGKRIKALNKKYRSKNKATDVLSFPLNGEVSARTTIGGIIALGDIFICLPIAKRCASQKGRSLSSELALLTVHGFLHLLGYDHEKLRNEAERMFKLQEKILKKVSSE